MNPTNSDSMIMEMMRYAKKAHEGQLRKFSLKPYITHPIRVANEVMLLPESTVAMVIAAIGHDLIEDTQTTKQDLCSMFNQEVADLIDELTNKFTKDTKPKLNREERKTLELQRLAACSTPAKIIKMLDRNDNLNEMDHLDKFTALYIKESYQLWSAIHEAHEDISKKLRETIISLKFKSHHSFCGYCELSPSKARCNLGNEILNFSEKSFS